MLLVRQTNHFLFRRGLKFSYKSKFNQRMSLKIKYNCYLIVQNFVIICSCGIWWRYYFLLTISDTERGALSKHSSTNSILSNRSWFLKFVFCALHWAGFLWLKQWFAGDSGVDYSNIPAENSETQMHASPGDVMSQWRTSWAWPCKASSWQIDKPLVETPAYFSVRFCPNLHQQWSWMLYFSRPRKCTVILEELHGCHFD